MSAVPAIQDRASDQEAMTDHALLTAWVEQRQSSDFTELVRRHIGLVRGVAVRQLGEDLADDTVQTVFSILARKAPGLRSLRSLSAWLHRVTTLQCRNAVRRLIRERRSKHAAMENALLNAARDPLDEAMPHLDAAINSLRESDRELILMRYSEGLSFAEASNRTGRSEAALRQQTGRALEALNRHLRRKGVAVPAAALGGCLGTLLSGPGTASAASACSARALAAASQLSAGALTLTTIATMNTMQSILAGSAAALLIVSGPILWRASQLRSAAKELTAIPAQRPLPQAPVKATVPTAASPVPKSGTTDKAKADDFLADMDRVMNEEMKSSFAEWARRYAWMEARRTGRLLHLPADQERRIREYVESLANERVSNGLDGESSEGHNLRNETEAKLEAWYAENLTADQNRVRREAATARKAATVERLAEESLYKVTSSVPLTEEQKTKLYEAAAAKVSKALEAGDYGGALTFGATIAPPEPPRLQETGADVIARVLDPAQVDLWEQALEQERIFSRVLPRRVADRTLETIRTYGVTGVVGSLIRETLGGGQE